MSHTDKSLKSIIGEKSKVGDCFIAISSENEIFCEKFNINKSREDFIEAVKNISFQIFIQYFWYYLIAIFGFAIIGIIFLFFVNQMIS